MTADDAGSDPATGTVRTGNVAGAGARIETGWAETVIGTGSHRSKSIVVEVGMRNGITNGRALVLHLFMYAK